MLGSLSGAVTYIVSTDVYTTSFIVPVSAALASPLSSLSQAAKSIGPFASTHKRLAGKPMRSPTTCSASILGGRMNDFAAQFATNSFLSKSKEAFQSSLYRKSRMPVDMWLKQYGKHGEGAMSSWAGTSWRPFRAFMKIRLSFFGFTLLILSILFSRRVQTGDLWSVSLTPIMRMRSE